MVNFDWCEAERNTAAGTSLVSSEVEDCEDNCQNKQENYRQRHQESKNKIKRLRSKITEN